MDTPNLSRCSLVELFAPLAIFRTVAREYLPSSYHAGPLPRALRIAVGATAIVAANDDGTAPQRVPDELYGPLVTWSADVRIAVIPYPRPRSFVTAGTPGSMYPTCNLRSAHRPNPHDRARIEPRTAVWIRRHLRELVEVQPCASASLPR
jgi:hypothetical protein